ncbi:hypothetical protein AB1Y20_019891 [Prymnesium parvum]|uniref:Uncharacterized protein n=1 Tax=Prymnesium parvum TaxID=97485 RepID=A0AB34JWC6_PRYPA
MEWKERNEHCEAMRRAAVACISMMFQTVDLLGLLAEANAPSRLQQLVSNPTRQVVSRRSALLALEVWDKTARLDNPAASKQATTQLQQLVTMLLSDKSLEMRALACRICSRLSCAGYQSGLVELGVPKLLLSQIEDNISKLFEAARSANAEVATSQTSCERPSMPSTPVSMPRTSASMPQTPASMPRSPPSIPRTPTSMPRASLTTCAKRASSGRGVKFHRGSLDASSAMGFSASEAQVKHVQSLGLPACVEQLGFVERDFEPGSLFYDALNSLVNLSAARCTQPAIARHGLWRLLQLRYASDGLAERVRKPPRPVTPSEDDAREREELSQVPINRLSDIAGMVGSILAAICTHTANLSVMYRAELQLKAAILGGKVHFDADRRLGSSASEPLLQRMHRDSFVTRDGVSSSLDPPATPSSTKLRYMHWLHQVTEEERSKHRSDADRPWLVQLHKAQLEKQNRLKTPRLDENDGSSPRGGVVSPTTPRASVVSPRVGSPQRSSRAANDTSPPRSGNSTPRKSGTYVAAEGDAKLISALLQPPIPECSDPLPDSLEILGLEAWPRRPAPPRLLPHDVPSPFNTATVAAFREGKDRAAAPTKQELGMKAGVDSDPQLQHRLYAALKQHRFLLFSLFAFYSAADGTLSTMSVKAYLALWTKCNVVDESLTNDALISIFFQAHQEQEPVENKRRRSVAKASDKDKADERMNLEGWLELLESCNLLDSEDNKTGPGLLDMDEATWCFIWSQDFVSDEVLRARAMQQLTFVGFMEALCRITMFIRLPDESSFAAYSASSIEDLYVKVANSAEEGEALHPAPKLDWQAEERSSAPINEAVDTLLRLMVCRLTQGASGLSIESIASRRDRLHAKKRKKAQKMAVKIDKQQVKLLQ